MTARTLDGAQLDEGDLTWTWNEDVDDEGRRGGWWACDRCDGGRATAVDPFTPGREGEAVMTCEICGGENAGKRSGICRACYEYLYARRVRRNRRSQSTCGQALAISIEQEIAKGTPTVAIMSRLDVDYGSVKSVRDDMDAAERSGDAA